MKIAVRIQWYSKGRAQPEELLASLAPLGAELVVDDIGLGCWDTARRCWLSGLEDKDATHVLVLADDALPCKDFCEVLPKAVACKPDNIVNLFSMKQTVEMRAKSLYDSGICWVDQNYWSSGIALLMPRALVEEFLAWEKEHANQHSADDEARVLIFALSTGRLISSCTTSLIEHDPRYGSLRISSLSNRMLPAYRFAGDKGPELQWSDASAVLRGDTRELMCRSRLFFNARSSALRENHID